MECGKSQVKRAGPALHILPSPIMTSELKFVVASEHKGQRLDVFLCSQMPDWSRSQLSRLIKSGHVRVGPLPATKSGELVGAGTTVSVEAQKDELRASPENLPLDVLYEDDGLLVINKPAGMVVHAGAGVRDGTLVNALLFRMGASLSTAGGALRPGIVHRLDRMTSGVMIVAKNDQVHRQLVEAFQERRIQKTYIALVHGSMRQNDGQIGSSVGRDPAHRARMKAGGLRGREALTTYHVLARWPGYTLVEASPKTGRTHQLRVHFSSIGHAVVGDVLYGGAQKPKFQGRPLLIPSRHFLHAARIQFQNPSKGELMDISAPLPPELREVIRSLNPSPSSSGS